MVAAVLALAAAGVLALAAPGVAGAAGFPGNSGSLTLTARHTRSTYAPTFTGNGLLGVRVPPTGQGYAGGTVPAQSELAGFYARPTRGGPRPAPRRWRRSTARRPPTGSRPRSPRP